MCRIPKKGPSSVTTCHDESRIGLKELVLFQDGWLWVWVWELRGLYNYRTLGLGAGVSNLATIRRR